MVISLTTLRLRYIKLKVSGAVFAPKLASNNKKTEAELGLIFRNIHVNYFGH